MVVWCIAELGAEGKVGASVGAVPEDGGRLGGVKIAHNNSDGV